MLYVYECVYEYYPGHLESVRQSYGASGQAEGVCASGSVCGQCARPLAWQERVSGSGSPQGNAWETHSQNLDKEIFSTLTRRGKILEKSSCLLG